jgi:hypothetical protein
MRPARVYAKIAPAAVHALHMPSHIFFASGMWDEAAASNEHSWAASVDRAKRKSLSASDHSFHALTWLQYAYLQLGRRADARRTLALMEADAKEGGGLTEESLDAMRAVWIVETGDCSMPPRPEAARARDRFARGLCALAGSDAAAARRELDAMKAAPAAKEAHAHPGMGYRESRDAEVAAVLSKELEAKIAGASGDSAAAARLAAEAAAAEDKFTFDFGPPPVIKPAHELAGEILLAAGRPADARRDFEASLASAPGRSLSLLGLMRSAQASGDAAAASDARLRLAKNWARADRDLPEGDAVRAAAGR